MNGSLWKSFGFLKKWLHFWFVNIKRYSIYSPTHIYGHFLRHFSHFYQVSIDITQTKRIRLQGPRNYQGCMAFVCSRNRLMLCNHELHFVFLPFFLSFFLSFFLPSFLSFFVPFLTKKKLKRKYFFRLLLRRLIFRVPTCHKLSVGLHSFLSPSLKISGYYLH